MATNFVTGTTPQLGGGNVFTENSLGQWELGGVTGPSVVRRVFDNSDNASSFTPSPGAIITDVICVAPGGGGGGCAASTGRELCAGGGGAGAWARSLLTPADIGASQTLTIPAGGAGGSAGANNGSAASDTSFGSLVVADGGGGGTHAASGDGGIAGVGGLEANCTGDETYPGENGGRGLWYDTTDLYQYGDALGGSTPWGKGGDSNSIGGGGAGSNAGAGQGYGAGGGGARGHNTASTYSGGAGSEGLIIVTEYIRQNAHWPIATDVNGNEVLDLTGGTASAVNFVDIDNAATGNGPSILAAGDDTNIDLALGGKGTGDIVPVSNDGAALGATSLGWSDLYLAAGGTLNWDNGDLSIAHTSGGSTYIDDAGEGDWYFRHTSTDTTGPRLILVNKKVALVDSNEVGAIRFQGYDDGGNSFNSYGLMKVQASDVSDGSEDGRFIFQTMVAGSGDTEVMRVDSNGISFDTGTNALDDYEEGTWTPTLETDGTHFSSVTYGYQEGKYTKIGRFVALTFAMYTSAVTKGSASSNVVIGGAPFTPASNVTGDIGYNSGWLGENPEALIMYGGTDIFLQYVASNVLTASQVSDVATGASANYVYGTIFYDTTA